jgi:DNA-binding transcriptional regulator GbsR (MarR family)
MPVDTVKAADEVFSRKHSLEIYSTIALLSKARFSTTEVAAASGVAQPEVSKELKLLSGVGLVLAHGRNDYERVDDPFWEVMEKLAGAWL